MNFRVSALAACLILGAGISAFGQSSTTGAAVLTESAAVMDGVQVSIRYYDKRVYYPESEIPIKVTISNSSPETYRFKLAEDRVYSIGFDVRTQTNRALDVADSYRKTLAASRPVYYREIAVEPGEEYSFVEKLNSYIAFKDPGAYTVRASFYPELIPGAPTGGAGSAAPIRSNVLILSMRPSAGLPPASSMVKADTGETLKAEAIPPDEVVRRTIVARQRSRWNEFFLYLDLESLYTEDAARKRGYDRDSDEGRRRAHERYKADLQESITDKDIVTVPSSFEIIETRYTAQSGVVRAIEKFDYGTFKMIKEYDYSLSRKDDVWYIVSYVVFNKGTE